MLSTTIHTYQPLSSLADHYRSRLTMYCMIIMNTTVITIKHDKKLSMNCYPPGAQQSLERPDLTLSVIHDALTAAAFPPWSAGGSSPAPWGGNPALRSSFWTTQTRRSLGAARGRRGAPLEPVILRGSNSVAHDDHEIQEVISVYLNCHY